MVKVKPKKTESAKMKNKTTDSSAKKEKLDKKNLFKDKNNQSKEKKKNKSHILKPLDNDTELEKQLQREVQQFLSGAEIGGKGSQERRKKKTDQGSLILNPKQLNKADYKTKLLKKSKKKVHDGYKSESQTKKRKKDKLSEEMDDFSLDVSTVIPKIKRKSEPHEKQNKVLSGRILKAKQKNDEKYKEKRLNRLFDRFDGIDLNASSSEAKLLGKRGRNKSKKLRKKERLLRALLKESRSGCTVEVGKNKPTIDTLKKQIKAMKMATVSKKTEKKMEKAKKRKHENVDTMDVDTSDVKESKKDKLKRKKSKKTASRKDFLKPLENQDSIVSSLETDLEKTKVKNAKKERKKNKKSKVEDGENEKPLKKRRVDDVEMEEMEVEEANGLESVGSGQKKEKYFNSKNTPLRERLMNKLKAARFRFLNEQMYTSESGESKKFFAQDPESFEAYHEGFKRQVEQWPINPVDVIIQSLQERDSKHRLIIADMGCGEAQLASCLEQHKVYSFDLVALNDRVTPCDMTHTSLKSDSVDVVVFCLSLMGTDLGACIKEANRILKQGGEMKIAEVESRFNNVEDFVKDVEKFGFQSTQVNLDYSIFCFLDFKKTSNISKTKKKKLPEVKLKPCLYKKR